MDDEMRAFLLVFELGIRQDTCELEYFVIVWVESTHL